ncbi:polysaccharide deacetylase family protein [Bhargavaea cecembensis]|uniref:polysaccharide deacetylase family protein n=1 Tax=Bhargavaea cecembensis TaxID=394098 RepID=UPI00058FA143|nr:polysaccharide deacetylase family protein [Bhargavaea cecembensis]
MNKFKILIPVFIVAIIILGIGLLGNKKEPSINETGEKKVLSNVTDSNTVIPVVNYHMFDEESDHGSINTRSEDFRAQLRHFKAMGYTSISNSELEAYLNGEAWLPPKPILITVDDGYKSVYDTAFPILKEEGFKAILFVITDNVEKGERVGLPMASWEQIKEMRDSGVFEIGNHTNALHLRHDNESGKEAFITNLSTDGKPITDAQRKEMILDDLALSNKIIETELGAAPKAFAYPFGAYDDISASAVKESGFSMVYTTETGVNTFNSNKMQLKRFNGSSMKDPLWYTDQFAEFEKKEKPNEPRVSLFKNEGDYVAASFLQNDVYQNGTSLSEVRCELWKEEKFVRNFGENDETAIDENQMVIARDGGEGLSGKYDLKVIFTMEDGTKAVEWKEVEF